jgi:hypothetical protein
MLVFVTRARSEPFAALAPHTYACTFDVRTSDVRGASGFGVGISYRLGGGRWQGFGEVGIGELASKGTWLGPFARAQVGARFLAATLSSTAHYAADFVLDGGGGVERDWLEDVLHIDRPYVFGGWGMQLRFPSRRSVEIMVRVVVSPPIEDRIALRTICRGTCTPSDHPPVDVGIDVVLGLAAW